MSQPFIDFTHVKEHASFERILDHYGLKLTGQGTQRAVLCPFHRERRPSCKIELERKIFHCFGCGEKGNVLEFVAKLDKTDLRTAALKITTVCSIAPAPPRGQTKKPTSPTSSTTALATKLTPTPREPVADDPAPSTDGTGNAPLTFQLKLDASHAYLTDRGLSAELVAEFGLGFCSRGLMKGRICIPIQDQDGNLVAYAGRWAGENVPADEGKYKLPPKFEKGRVLFNLHRIQRGTPHLVLVEGFWSTFRLHALGVPVVGLMGWSVSPEQVELLLEWGVTSATLLLDGDEAGYRGRERLLPLLANSFFVLAPKLEEGEKPDTLDEAKLAELVAGPPAD